MQLSAFFYDNTYAVYELLQQINLAVEVHSATASHFVITEEQRGNVLSVQAKNYMHALQKDQLIQVFDLHEPILQYCQDYQLLPQWNQQLKAVLARQKTLLLRQKNLEKELSKAGLFKGKLKQQLEQKLKQAHKIYSQTQDERQALEGKVNELEQLRRTIARQIQSNTALQNARWLYHEQKVIALSESGQFLLEYLQEIKVEVMYNRPLSQVLLYGHQWSRQI